MYYEDENNLYHYSYRKGDTNVVEPVYNTRNYAEETAAPAKELPKKKGRWAKMVALMLACSLAGGAVGAGAIGMARTSVGGAGLSRDGAATTAIEVAEREAPHVETVKVTGNQKLSFSELYAANVNSVVSINTNITTTNIYNQTVETPASGSGFIITADGYIVTNYHVIEGANTVKATLYNGETYDAEIVGGDADYDIAVLKINASGLQAVTIGDSSALLIGEDVALIGNPLGELTFSISEGIVSCADREINLDGTPFNMIQVTAAINPGNSGGPLFNSYGEVIGIVTAKYTRYSTTTAEALGFAIPINDVIAMVRDIMQNGRVTNLPYFGISVEDVTERRARQNGYGVNAGARVASVDEGSAADHAALKVGDIIVKLGDKEVTSIASLNAAKKYYKAGDTTSVTVFRDGEEIELSLTVDARPETVAQPEESQQEPAPGNGGFYYYGDGENGGIYDPWNFFNDFFNGGYYGGNGRIGSEEG